MKKLLFLLLAMVTTNVTAQNLGMEELSPANIKGDELLGTKDRIVWQSEHVTIDEGKYGPVITLKQEGHVFIPSNPKYGMYNTNDSLIGAPYMCTFNMPTQDGQHYTIMGAVFAKDSIPGSDFQDKKSRWRLRMDDLVKWMQEEHGTLRIVTKVYGGYMYDIRFRFKKEE